MDADEKAALKSAFPVHAFLRVIHPLGSAIIALPRKQASEEKVAAVELWHASTVKLGVA
jgi:hypothetical protein